MKYKKYLKLLRLLKEIHEISGTDFDDNNEVLSKNAFIIPEDIYNKICDEIGTNEIYLLGISWIFSIFVKKFSGP